jgi:hypothetical protein
VDDAMNVMQEAHESGVALVVACAQDQAEGYVEDLRLNGEAGHGSGVCVGGSPRVRGLLLVSHRVLMRAGLRHAQFRAAQAYQQVLVGAFGKKVAGATKAVWQAQLKHAG